MSKFKVLIVQDYQEYLNDLKDTNPNLRKRLCDRILEIKTNPYKSKFKHLKNTNGYRRARVGKYRIIFYIKKEVVFITKIGLRNTIYKKV